MSVLREDIKKTAEKVAREWGFSSVDEFINEAVEERILELQKHKFFERSDKIREGLERGNISEKDILNDFERKRTQS